MTATTQMTNKWNCQHVLVNF